jgi:hypothetical protein
VSLRDRDSVWVRIWTRVRYLIGSCGLGAEAVLLAAGKLLILETEWDYRCLDDLDC